MKILCLEYNFHHKNRNGLERMIYHLNYELNYGNYKDIEHYDVIYSPTIPFDTSQYPTKKFIFGPHFSVFPTNILLNIKNINNNSVYIQPSKWACDVWKNMGVEKIIQVKPLSFPVDTQKFSPINKKRDKVFIYYKRRHPQELEFIKTFLQNKGIKYKIFDYVKKYIEEDYLHYLQESKYGIVLDAHESQGFAIQEALSCDVPLLVWNTKFMSQEYGSKYKNIPCSTIPYWDKICGEFFYEQNEFEDKFEIFTNNLEKYKPRKFILENLSVDKCSKNLVNLIN